MFCSTLGLFHIHILRRGVRLANGQGVCSANSGCKLSCLTQRNPMSKDGIFTMAGKSNYDRIYDVARKIPSGNVATYGQVAKLAGLPGHARQVGYALNALADDSDVPWHRVINSQGRISARSFFGTDNEQMNLLVAEGVEFDETGHTSLTKFRWEP